MHGMPTHGRRQRAVRLFVMLAMLLAPAALAGGLIHDGPAPDAIFLSTGDVIGYLDPCG
ncbi:MAG: hypothetical protein GY716_24010 [bacterium]|nr:hypothetical protein [bacterium]